MSDNNLKISLCKNDICACTYCDHLYEDPKTSAVECMNSESQFYYLRDLPKDMLAAEKMLASPNLLTPKQYMKGCEKIEIHSLIPISFFSYIPEDSSIRLLDSNKIIKQPKFPSSGKTVEDLIKEP
jgi:hypothetical protein